jgi:hypothetical protein
MPQDVKLTPDGRVYYVPVMALGGMWTIGCVHPQPGRYSLGHTAVFR